MAYGGQAITFSELVSGTIGVVGRNLRLVGLFALGVGLANAGASTLLGEGGGSLVQLLIGLAAGYFLLIAFLRAEGFAPREGPIGNFGGYLGAMVLSGLATIFGFVFLILPGLIFMSRWSIAGALAVRENIGGTDAMRQSWEATRNSQWSLVGFYVVLFLVLVMFGGLAGGLVGASVAVGMGPQGFTGGLGAFLVVAVTNVASQAATACGTAVVMAILHRLSPSEEGLGEVFA